MAASAALPTVIWDSLCSNEWYGPDKSRTLHWELTVVNHTLSCIA